MTKLSRRKMLKTAGISAAATAIAAPAVAQSMPEIKWRLTTSFPKSLDTLHGGAEVLAKAVAEATDNKFQISVFAVAMLVAVRAQCPHAERLGISPRRHRADE